jgi:hypothetical protein
MPTRSDNTFQEELLKMNRNIADMKALPDANLEFLASMETMVLGQLRAPVDAMEQQGLTNAPSSLAGGAPPAPGGMPTLGPGGGGPGGGGGMGMGMGPANGGPPMVGANLPPPDELRRLLGGGNHG